MKINVSVNLNVGVELTEAETLEIVRAAERVELSHRNNNHNNRNNRNNRNYNNRNNISDIVEKEIKKQLNAAKNGGKEYIEV